MAPGFTVVAILAAYNEADVIDHVVGDLISQGLSVYFLDDGSTDDTVAIVEKYVGHGVIAIERLPDGDAGAPHGWERILRRKAEVADRIEADWFIHHDADEFRESPWSLSLHDAIRRVDELGFSAIDFAGFDFWPDHDGFRPGDDVRRAFDYYANPGPYDSVQIRAWRKTAGVDLVSSGGHEAQFAGRKVFPLRFILRHYPVRGQQHGARKVFLERRERFPEVERARGWHRQYSQQAGESFVRDRSTLIRYDGEAVRVQLALRHRDAEALGIEVARQSDVIESHRRDLDRMVAELDHVAAERDRVLAEVEAARVLIASRDVELDRARASIAGRDVSLEEIRTLVASRETDITRLKAVVQRQRADIEDLARNVADLDQALQDRARRVDALLASLSWRWTAPARAVFRMFGGR